jgi:hypothetical protein
MKYIHTFESFVEDYDFNLIEQNLLENEELNEREYASLDDIKVGDPKVNSGSTHGIDRAYVTKDGEKAWTTGDYRLANTEQDGRILAPMVLAAVQKAFGAFKQKFPKKDALDCASSFISAIINGEKKGKKAPEVIKSLMDRWIETPKEKAAKRAAKAKAPKAAK